MSKAKIVIKKELTLEPGNSSVDYEKLLDYHKKDLECQLEALAISMQLFLQLLTNIATIHQNLKVSKELHHIVTIIGAYTKKQLGFMCES